VIWGLKLTKYLESTILVSRFRSETFIYLIN